MVWMKHIYITLHKVDISIHIQQLHPSITFPSTWKWIQSEKMTAFNQSSSTSAYLSDWLSNRWVLCSSWEPWWLHTSLCCCSSTCPVLTVTVTTLLCRYNETRTRNVCVWECQDGTGNQYETAQIKVLVNELVPTQRTSHTMLLSPKETLTLRNEIASLWRANQYIYYWNLKPSTPVLTFQTLRSAHKVCFCVFCISLK